MPPKRGESIERNAEFEEFVGKLSEYHEKRGTTLDTQPKVGIRHVDLLKLYKRVVEEGGYDLVSDTKAKPLMWRKLAEEFVGKNVYTAAQAFQIKNVYYKNLCAYEISTHWGKDPPPKEILEDVTAKGGNVMTRTLENFSRPQRRDEKDLDNGSGSDTSPEQKTPKEEKVADDDPGSAHGRTRGLRQQPPQRVLFQPDLSASRQTRGQIGVSGSPVPVPPTTNGVVNATAVSNGVSSALASYEPSQSYPLSLKPVVTPANNPDYYRNERKRKLEASAGPLARKYRNIMLPGTGFIGPNIYVRAQLALQSGLPEEETYALHHLVKISHERGDKYRFDQFPGLAEALLKKVLQVSSLFYDVQWDVSYDDDINPSDTELLNGLRGTPDAIQKLRSHIPRYTNDQMHDPAFVSQLNRISEAGLVIRNMCMLEANAQYLSSYPLVRDYLAIVLGLPQHSQIIELRHYALETAEQVLKYCDLGPDNALYHCLLDQLWGEDRGAIALALRTISRIAMTLPPPKRLEDVPDEILQKVQDWLMIEDEELRGACLDFFMQYTSFADNVDNLLQAVDAEALARQLSRLLFFSAKEHKVVHASSRLDKVEAPVPVARLSRSVVDTLLKLDEPERSSEWLRMCFVADANADMTQISLWQAYQGTFGAFHATHQHLVAGDFIKNVSTTFTGATAQVAAANKYVIRGIRSRKVPVDSGATPGSRPSDKGKELAKCCWRVAYQVEGPRDPMTGSQTAPITTERECGEWFRTGADILKHVLSGHLRLPTRSVSPVEKLATETDNMDVDSPISRPTSTLPNGVHSAPKNRTLGENFDFHEADKTTYRCRWADCTRISNGFDTSSVPRTALFVRHIQTHIPDMSKPKHNLKPDADPTPAHMETSYFTTLQDEKHDAAGIPLGAALVLRNIAKFFPQAQPGAANDVAPQKIATNGDVKEEGLMQRVFSDEIQERLVAAVATNRTMREYVGSVLLHVKANGG